MRFLDYLSWYRPGGGIEPDFLTKPRKPLTAEEQAKIDEVVSKVKELAKDWEALPGFPVVMRRRTKSPEET